VVWHVESAGGLSNPKDFTGWPIGKGRETKEREAESLAGGGCWGREREILRGLKSYRQKFSRPFEKRGEEGREKKFSAGETEKYGESGNSEKEEGG